MITLPEAFEQEMKQLLGEEEYEAYRKTFDEAVHRGLRVNNGKISTEEVLRRTDIPLKKVPWIPNGFYYDEELQSGKGCRLLCGPVLSAGAECDDTGIPPSN